MRLAFALLAVAATLTLAGGRTRAGAGQAPASISVVEASITDLRRAMADGRTTSRAITAQYLARIARYNGTLNAAITINPRALAEADARDRERREGRARGSLHGIPVALKDNIQTLDMPTTGGALAFARLRAPYEATVTARLRAAGAIILAKTTLTELANWVAAGMPAGYNALTRYSLNPYDPRLDPRSREQEAPPLLSPGGSSSGVGTAASFWAANVGTETSGSILNPANQNMLVGIKPTVGRISRHGVIPITADQDTPGPLARTVEDAARLLGALEGNEPDPNDPATGRCTPPRDGDYTPFLRGTGLRGARIGIPRAFFYDRLDSAASGGATGGLTAAQHQVMTEAIAAIRAAGATVVDPADLPSVIATPPADNLPEWRICVGRADAQRGDAGCSIVLKYGMKRDFNAWLASLGSDAPVKSLTELRAWNAAHAEEGAIRFGQDQLDASDGVDLAADRPRYLADRRTDLALTGRDGIDAALQAHGLDALLFPGYFGASVSARAGYPAIIVPFGMLPDTFLPPLPRGVAARPAPFGVSFAGTACSEPRLIELAFAFEQATRRRVAPALD
jgi:amidase